MQYKIMKSSRNAAPRRVRVSPPSSEQYSLFAAARSPEADARHFERQAQLCQRLLSGVHQPELVELLGRLHDEFEAKAGHGGAPTSIVDKMADDPAVG